MKVGPEWFVPGQKADVYRSKKERGGVEKRDVVVYILC